MNDLVQPTTDREAAQCDHPSTEKTLGEFYWETFEQHLADEKRTMLGPWEDVPDWQKPSIEFAAQAVRAQVIEECAVRLDELAKKAPKRDGEVIESVAWAIRSLAGSDAS